MQPAVHRVWRCTQVGRRGAPAKGVGRDNRRGSSNLPISASQVHNGNVVDLFFASEGNTENSGKYGVAYLFVFKWAAPFLFEIEKSRSPWRHRAFWLCNLHKYIKNILWNMRIDKDFSLCYNANSNGKAFAQQFFIKKGNGHETIIINFLDCSHDSGDVCHRDHGRSRSHRYR